MGKVDAEGDLTGDDVIYVYPDFKTLLVGEFRKSVMIAARLAFTRDVKFDDVTGIPVIVGSSNKALWTTSLYTKPVCYRTICGNKYPQNQ